MWIVIRSPIYWSVFNSLNLLLSWCANATHSEIGQYLTKLARKLRILLALYEKVRNYKLPELESHGSWLLQIFLDTHQALASTHTASAVKTLVSWNPTEMSCAIHSLAITTDLFTVELSGAIAQLGPEGSFRVPMVSVPTMWTRNRHPHV